jgi:tRNA/rRNA methyltransferase
VTRCHHLIRIPTGADYPALNLAQAVAICLHEVRTAWDRLEPAAEPALPLASFAEQQAMFSHLQTALEEIHFLYGEKAGPLMHAVRHLLGRAGLSVMEVKLLHGVARQIRWHVANHPAKTSDEPPMEPTP